MIATDLPSCSGGFGVTVLGSGSKGNASVIHGPDGNILLDCGFSRKDLESRLDSANIDPGSIFALLITHAHSDHSKHFGFCRERNIPVYLLGETFKALTQKDTPAPCLCDCQCNLITAGSSFDLCNVHVESFEVSHDVNTVGYVFQANGHKITYATDIGHMTNLVRNKLTGADIIILESNYDPAMLRNSNRTMKLKRRIASNIGHLNNQTAMDTMKDVVTQETGAVILAHISQECNSMELVQNLAQTRLADMNRPDVSLMLAKQDEPLPTIWVK